MDQSLANNLCNLMIHTWTAENMQHNQENKSSNEWWGVATENIQDFDTLHLVISILKSTE